MEKNVEKVSKSSTAKKEKNVKQTATVKKTKKGSNKTVKEPYVKGVKKELKQVKWPSFKEIVKYTIATIILCLILVAFFELLNVFMAFVKGLFN